MLKTKGTDIVVYIILGLLLIGASGAWYYFNLQKTELNLKVQDERNQITVAEKQIKLLHELRTKSPEIEAEKQRLGAFIPTKENQAQFIMDLEKLADKCNVELKSCKLNNPTKQFKDQGLSHFVIYQWRLQFSGSYLSVMNFFDELQNFYRFIKVSDVKFDSFHPEEKSSGMKLNVDCGLDLITVPADEKVKQ